MQSRSRLTPNASDKTPADSLFFGAGLFWQPCKPEAAGEGSPQRFMLEETTGVEFGYSKVRFNIEILAERLFSITRLAEMREVGSEYTHGTRMARILCQDLACPAGTFLKLRLPKASERHSLC